MKDKTINILNHKIKISLLLCIACIAIAITPLSVLAGSASGFNAQYIKVNSGEFVQVKATEWKGVNSGRLNGNYYEIIRTPTKLKLQNTNTSEILIFDFAADEMYSKLGNNAKKQEGSIQNVTDANAYTLHGVSVIQNSPSQRQQMNLDQPFTDTGLPSGWMQAIYTAPGGNIQETNGHTVNRVMIQNGITYLRLPDASLPSGTAPGTFDTLKIWGKFEAFNQSNASSSNWATSLDKMLKPLEVYTEINRDGKSIYFAKFGTVNKPKMSDAILQIDYHLKKVTGMGSNNQGADSILPEFFPGSDQFRRVSYEAKTDNQLSLNRGITRNGSIVKLAGHEMRLYDNQCSPGNGFSSCEIMQGAYSPRSVTGQSIGSFELKVTSPRTGQIVDVLAFVNSRQPTFSMTQVATPAGIAVMPKDAINLRPLVALNKTRNAIILGNEEFRKVGKLDLTTGLFSKDNAEFSTSIIEGPVNYLREFYPGQFRNEVPIPVATKGPGFQITNKTDYPILISIDQVGCLEHGIIEAGDTFSVDTGAVWFTVVASMSPDLEDPTDLECATQPLIMAGGIAVTGIMTVVTFGSATAPVAMLVAAVGAGAAAGTEAALIADGMSEQDARLAGAGIMLFSSMATGGVNSFFSTSVEQVTKNVAKAGLISILKSGGRELVLLDTTDEHLSELQTQLEQKVSKAGVFAGHTWPWPEDEQTKAIFEVTGGPTKTILSDGKTVEFKLQEHPLTLTELPRQ